MLRHTCTKQEFESLLGHLSYAATVIPQAESGLSSASFRTLFSKQRTHRFLRLNAGAKADLMWGQTFLQDWNGTSFFPATNTTIEVFSDASGTFGCGAFAHPQGWFQLQWPVDWQSFISQQRSWCLLQFRQLYGGLNGPVNISTLG